MERGGEESRIEKIMEAIKGIVRINMTKMRGGGGGRERKRAQKRKTNLQHTEKQKHTMDC